MIRTVEVNFSLLFAIQNRLTALHNLLQSSIGYNVFNVICNIRIILSPENLEFISFYTLYPSTHDILLFYNDSPEKNPTYDATKITESKTCSMKQKAQIHWLVLLADAAAEQALMSGSVHFAMPISEPRDTVCASMCVRGFPCLTKPPKLWLQLKVNCHCPLIRNVAPCFVWRGSHCLRATELLHK